MKDNKGNVWIRVEDYSYAKQLIENVLNGVADDDELRSVVNDGVARMDSILKQWDGTSGVLHGWVKCEAADIPQLREAADVFRDASAMFDEAWDNDESEDGDDMYTVSDILRGASTSWGQTPAGCEHWDWEQV